MERYENSPDKLEIWEEEGISGESMARFCVKYDALSNRIVYPVKNIKGDIVNVGGRTLDPDYKEKGLRKYTYFMQWGTIDTIYGVSDNIDFIKSKREIILFEGAKSVMKADTWGIRNTGAILTSHPNDAQVKILVSLGCDVVFALDKDVDPRIDKKIQKLRRYVNVFAVIDKNNLLTGEKDSPVDCGKDIFEELYQQKIRI